MPCTAGAWATQRGRRITCIGNRCASLSMQPVRQDVHGGAAWRRRAPLLLGLRHRAGHGALRGRASVIKRDAQTGVCVAAHRLQSAERVGNAEALDASCARETTFCIGSAVPTGVADPAGCRTSGNHPWSQGVTRDDIPTLAGTGVRWRSDSVRSQCRIGSDKRAHPVGSLRLQGFFATVPPSQGGQIEATNPEESQ